MMWLKDAIAGFGLLAFILWAFTAAQVAAAALT
jgi:hypothetical protein